MEEVPVNMGWLTAQDRVLITGASGWFGSTMVNMLQKRCAVLTTGSHRSSNHEPWELKKVKQFSPTIVANFAFNTRDKIAVMGESRYRLENQLLIDQMASSFGLPEVRLGVTVSSGAALQQDSENFQDSYSELKRLEEEVAQSLATATRKIVIGRAFSVSGPFVRRVKSYAFSDLVYQALEGLMIVRASVPTFRRYVSVDDFLNVCMSFGTNSSGVIESGGDLVEMIELATRIRDLVNSKAKLDLPDYGQGEAQVYASDNMSWQTALEVTGCSTKSLDQQILAVAEFLRDKGTFL